MAENTQHGDSSGDDDAAPSVRQRPRRRFGWGVVRVRGRSMEPTVHDGDLLAVRWAATPRPGDLVVVALPDRPASIKRAIDQRDGGWWVERDSTIAGVDSWNVGAIPPGDVLGVARRPIKLHPASTYRRS